MSCISIYDSPDAGAFTNSRRFPVKAGGEKEDELGSGSSSSIGRNSDSSGRSSDGDDSGETEVQSSYKGPLDTMDALEDVLPIKRGISNFYRGKSKSFTSLADASSSSIKDIAKPENAYTRKRKNLMAHSQFWDKNLNSSVRRSDSGGGISKRLALSAGGNNNNNGEGSSNSNSNSNSPSPPHCLPPLHPRSKISPTSGSSMPPAQTFSSMRSFSLSDLQCMPPSAGGLVKNKREKDKNILH